MTTRTCAISLVLFSCASSERRDSSVAAHRAAALRELDAAREAEAAPPAEGTVAFLKAMSSEAASENHLRHAVEHERVAAELERFEAHACGAIPPGQRAACPLLFGLRAVEDRPDGVRLWFGAGADIHAIAAQMRCHMAFARARGWDPSLTCALYLRGVSVLVELDSIDLATGSRGLVRELQRRARVELPILRSGQQR